MNRKTCLLSTAVHNQLIGNTQHGQPGGWCRNGPLTAEVISGQKLIAISSDVSRPAGDLVGLGRWTSTTRAGDPRTLAYLVDAPEGR